MLIKSFSWSSLPPHSTLNSLFGTSCHSHSRICIFDFVLFCSVRFFSRSLVSSLLCFYFTFCRGRKIYSQYRRTYTNWIYVHSFDCIWLTKFVACSSFSLPLKTDKKFRYKKRRCCVYFREMQISPGIRRRFGVQINKQTNKQTTMRKWAKRKVWAVERRTGGEETIHQSEHSILCVYVFQ